MINWVRPCKLKKLTFLLLQLLHTRSLRIAASFTANDTRFAPPRGCQVGSLAETLPTTLTKHHFPIIAASLTEQRQCTTNFTAYTPAHQRLRWDSRRSLTYLLEDRTPSPRGLGLGFKWTA